MVIDFALPELGENIETGNVVEVLVKPGDAIEADQPVIELETDKATIEVPSPAAGTVGTVAVENGETVAVGQVILTIETADSNAPDRSATPSEVEPRVLTPSEPAPPPSVEESPPPSGPLPSASPPATRPGRTTLAAPSVRRLAREFGVDVGDVPGSAARGRVSADDVKAYARRVLQAARHSAPATSEEPELPDFTRWGPVERTRMRSIRRATVRQMTRSWRTIPHVTQHDRADVTQFESVRKRLKKESPDVPLTVTAFTVMTLAAALKKFPQFNASLDVASEEIVFKQYINIGVAVDTDRGLLGEFKWSSQHLKWEELRWEQLRVDELIMQDAFRGGRPVVHRWGGGSIGRDSGRRLRAGCRARMLGWRPVCRRRSARGGSATMAGCRQAI